MGFFLYKIQENSKAPPAENRLVASAIFILLASFLSPFPLDGNPVPVDTVTCKWVSEDDGTVTVRVAVVKSTPLAVARELSADEASKGLSKYSAGAAMTSVQTALLVLSAITHSIVSPTLPTLEERANVDGP